MTLKRKKEIAIGHQMFLVVVILWTTLQGISFYTSEARMTTSININNVPTIAVNAVKQENSNKGIRRSIGKDTAISSAVSLIGCPKLDQIYI